MLWSSCILHCAGNDTICYPKFHSPVAVITDIPLPSVEVPANGQPQLQAIRFDHFDFQVLDSQNGLLFIAHPGPVV